MPRLLSVLIVEDHPDSAMSLAVLLSLFGYKVQTARDGNEAEQCVRLDPPHVLLMDIGLPGEDGYAVAKRLRSIMGRKPLLVALTGFGQDKDIQRSRNEGFDHHLLKPADPRELVSLLETFRDERGECSLNKGGPSSARTVIDDPRERQAVDYRSGQGFACHPGAACRPSEPRLLPPED